MEGKGRQNEECMKKEKGKRTVMEGNAGLNKRDR